MNQATLRSISAPVRGETGHDVGFLFILNKMGGFPSGQRGQTVNLLHIASVVRIHHHPVCPKVSRGDGFLRTRFPVALMLGITHDIAKYVRLYKRRDRSRCWFSALRELFDTQFYKQHFHFVKMSLGHEGSVIAKR